MQLIGRPGKPAEVCDRRKSTYFVDVHVDQHS